MEEIEKKNSQSNNLGSDIHFYQGKYEIIKDKDDNKNIVAIQNKIKELCNLKNVSFLFGSGTSSPAIPIMSELFDQFEPTSKDEKTLYNELCSKEKTKKSKNLETILGVLYSGKNYLEVVSSVNNRCKVFYKEDIINNLINNIEQHIFDCININILDKGKDKGVLETYKNFF